MRSTEKIRKIKLYFRNYYDYIAIAVLYVVLHFFIHTDYWDDLRNANILADNNYNIFKYGIQVYYSWSSRILIQPVFVLFNGLPNYIWKIVDVIMILMVYHFILRMAEMITGHSNRKYMLWCFLFFLCFPYSLMATAGWITTTITYTWTFAAYFYCLYLLLRSSQEEKCSMAQYLLYGFAVFWAGNFNITSISLLLLLSGIYFVYNRNRTVTVLYLEGMFLTIINFILFVASPGNRNRNLRDAQFHDTEELINLSLVGKLRMGINSTFYHFVSVPNVVLFITCFILAICVWRKSTRMSQRAIGLIPISLDILWTCYMFVAYIIRNGVLTYTYPDGEFITCPKTEQYLAMFSAIIMIASICYLLVFLTDFTKISFMLASMILIFALLPEVALGFTTTVTASAIRMSTFLYMAFMFCDYVIVEYCGLLKIRFWRSAMYLLGGIGMVLNVMQIIRHILVYG